MSNPFHEYCPKCDAHHAAGDCTAWLMKQYHDLRSHLAEAQARAEKAEAALQQSKELHDFFFERSKCLEASLDLARKDIKIRQARAERAEGEVECIARMAHDSAVEMAASYLERIGDYGSESKANSIRGEAFDDWRAFKERHLTTPAPQGRTDGERLDWLLDLIMHHGTDGVAAILWTVVEEDGEDSELAFDRAAIDEGIVLYHKPSEATLPPIEQCDPDATAPEVKGGGE
jgi:hypothetical protein